MEIRVLLTRLASLITFSGHDFHSRVKYVSRPKLQILGVNGTHSTQAQIPKQISGIFW